MDHSENFTMQKTVIMLTPILYNDKIIAYAVCQLDSSQKETAIIRWRIKKSSIVRTFYHGRRSK